MCLPKKNLLQIITNFKIWQYSEIHLIRLKCYFHIFHKNIFCKNWYFDFQDQICKSDNILLFIISCRLKKKKKKKKKIKQISFNSIQCFCNRPMVNKQISTLSKIILFKYKSNVQFLRLSLNL